MFNRFLPKEVRFFDLFRSCGSNIYLAATELLESLKNPASATSHADKISALEDAADAITRETLDLVHTCFITPLDRGTIHKLAIKLDDVIDYIDAVSRRLVHYEIKSLPEGTIRLGQIIVECTRIISEALNGLEPLKDPVAVRSYCRQISILESEADEIQRSIVADLFRNEMDIRDLIKFKEIIELLESITDRAAEAAHILDTIVLEHG